MSNPKTENLYQLRMLQDMLVEATDKLTDKELMSELKAGGQDPAKYSERFKSILGQAKAQAGKRRLQIAKQAVAATHQTKPQIAATNIQLARLQIKRLVANDPDGAQVMLAARNATAKDVDSLPDKDVLALAEMAALLGKIPSGDDK